MGFFLGLSLRGEKRNDKIKGQTGKNCRAENAGDSYLHNQIPQGFIILRPGNRPMFQKSIQQLLLAPEELFLLLFVIF